MKRLLLFILLISSVQLAFAHAGIFDRYLEHFVSSRAILVTLLVTHIVLLLCVKLFRKWLHGYKRVLLRITKWIKQQQITTMVSSWLLCSIVYGTYVCLLSDHIYLFGGVLGLIFAMIFPILVCIKKTQRKFILGFRPLYYYLQSSLFILIGLALYDVLCLCDWYRDCFVLVDEVCDSLSVNLYPQRKGIITLAQSMLEIAICLLVPYMVLGISRLCKYASNRKRAEFNQ